MCRLSCLFQLFTSTVVIMVLGMYGQYMGEDILSSTKYNFLLSSEIKDYKYLPSWNEFVQEVKEWCMRVNVTKVPWECTKPV